MNSPYLRGDHAVDGFMLEVSRGRVICVCKKDRTADLIRSSPYSTGTVEHHLDII